MIKGEKRKKEKRLLAAVKKKSDNLFTNLYGSSVKDPSSKRGTSDLSNLLQTALATCKLKQNKSLKIKIAK